jgi:ATP-dependent DNA helicase RecQ
MVYGLQDVIKLRQMGEESQANENIKRLQHQRLQAMLGFCEITSCRREAILRYFHEQSSEHCGNCDNCLTPVDTWEATDAARKALSCVYRTGQRFGVNHLIDVLLGKATDKIQQFQHDRVSTFGIGAELSSHQWRSVYRQLIARGYLAVDMDGFGGLRLNAKCRPLLKGEESIALRHDPSKKTASAKKSRSPSQSGLRASPLFDILRQQRLTLAREQEIAPYMIFSDATLEAMVKHHPLTLDEMLTISGVGAHKLEHYGEIFLTLLKDNQHLKQNPALGDSAQSTLQLFRQHNSADKVAEQRQLTLTTIYEHLGQAIEANELALADVICLPEEELQQICQLMQQYYQEHQELKLKPIFESCEGRYEYHLLRCVAAHWRNSQ